MEDKKKKKQDEKKKKEAAQKKVGLQSVFETHMLLSCCCNCSFLFFIIW